MIDPIFWVLAVFGVWISYTDIKKGEIKNYAILLLAAAAIIVNVFFSGAFIKFPLASFLNIFGAILTGVLIWLAGIWSAADTKFFIALNLLFPVTLYHNYHGYFPGFVLLTNSAVPFFFFLLAQILLKTSFSKIKQALSVHLRLGTILRLLLVSTAMLSLTTVISYFFKIRIEYMAWIMLLFLAFWLIDQKFKIEMTYFFIFAILFSLLAALIFDLPIFRADLLVMIAIFFFFALFMFILLEMGISSFTRPVAVDKLNKGMILAEAIVREPDGYIKKPITFFSFFVLLRQRAKLKPLFGFNPDGLEDDEVEKLRSLAENKLLKFNEINVCLVMPLAPLLFLGAVITYFLKGSIVF